MEETTNHGLERTATSVCVNEDGNVENDYRDYLHICHLSSHDMDNMGTFCCETIDFDEFHVSSKSPSMCNVLEMEGCQGEDGPNRVRDGCLTNDDPFVSELGLDKTFRDKVKDFGMNKGEDGGDTRNDQRYDLGNVNVGDERREESRNNSKHEEFGKGVSTGETSPEFVVLDPHDNHHDKRKTAQKDDDDDDTVDVSAGLRELLHKLFLAIKRFIPIKSDNIQELLERSPFEETMERQRRDSDGKDDDSAMPRGVELRPDDIFEFENILQKLFHNFQEEWINYQSFQDRRLDEVFMRGVQAARHHAEVEAAEAREEAARQETPRFPDIIGKCSTMIRELRRERSILAKYVIEKQREWSVLRESLTREITTLRKDNTRLLSNKLASVNGSAHGKASKIAPFNQRTLEAMVHSKYCLEKALMLDVAKQSKINELHLAILQQQEHVRELQAKLFDLTSRPMIDEIEKQSPEHEPIVNTKPRLSDSELLDYIIKDMTSRLLSRDDIDSVHQALYCDEDYYLPNNATSADLATLQVYCLGGTWRSNVNCPKLNEKHARYDTGQSKQGGDASDGDHCKPAGESGDAGDTGEKTTIIVTSPKGENTPR